MESSPRPLIPAAFESLESRLFLSGTPTMLPGDANGDGAVDVGDLGILGVNYGQTTGMTLAQADFTGDGAVDVGDLGILGANWGRRVGTAIEITMPAVPDVPATSIYAAPWDSTSGWGPCSLPEDRPISYSAVTNPVHQGAGAVKFVFNSSVGPLGMKYFGVGNVTGSDGVAFWVYGDASGTTIQLRLSQGDWSAWDTPTMAVNWTGWKRVVFLKSDCVFQNWGGNGQNWNGVKTLAYRQSGKSGTVILDDLHFYSGTAALKVQEIPAAAPVWLEVDQSQLLPAVPNTLKGVDFALINWGASQADYNFGANTENLFKASGAKLVRFWTFCPPLNPSTGLGTYDWTRFDIQMGKIYADGAEAIMTNCFTPPWLSVDGTKEGMPKNWTQYEQVIKDVVAHCKAKGWNVRLWEVWNEPNLSGGGFLKGTMADFQTIYSHFTHAVKAADSTAMVGGGGFASPDMVWINGLRDYAHTNSLPLDFMSWHVYDMMPDGIAASIDAVRGSLATYPEFAGTKLIIDEWNSYGGTQNQYDTEYAAAYQAAALDRMLQKGLYAQTFFAFKESGNEWAGSWGMITKNDTPKASFESFRIFSELTGQRLATYGADGEVGAIAAQNGAGVDIMLYRFQPDPTAPDRDVHLSLPHWTAGPMKITLELVDNAYSNPSFDTSDVTERQLQVVGSWTAVDMAELSQIVISLRPLSVARLRITPIAGGSAGPLFLGDDAMLPVVYPGAVVDLPGGSAVTWTLPSGWSLSADGQHVTVPADEREARHAYLIGQWGGQTGTLRLDVVPASVNATIRLQDETRPWRVGTGQQATMVVHNYQPVAVTGTASIWNDAGMQIAPTSQLFTIAPGGTWQGSFDVTLPGSATGETLIVYPKVIVTGLMMNGQPLAVTDPAPLAQPVADQYTTLLSTLGSSSAIASPVKGPGGSLTLGDGSFQSSVFGGGVLLKNGKVTFPTSAFPSQVGSVEMWLTPQWNGASAPDWATFFLATSATGWAKSMWDFRVDASNGKHQLLWSLYEDNGAGHNVAADISGWVAGVSHHVMLTWNAYTGHQALYVDGVLAQERTTAGGLALSSNITGVQLNSPSGRSSANTIFGPIRISNVERVPGSTLPPPDVDVIATGLQLPIVL